jgi:hypothetical protein
MAVAQILSGVSRLAQNRAAIRPYLAHTVWVFVLFIYIFVIWWATWEFRSIEWTFPRYVYMLIAPTLLFFACSLLMPQRLGENDVDLEAHFFRIRRPLLWSFLLTSAAVMVDGNILGDEAIWHRGRIGHAVMIGAPAWGLYTANRRAHNAISIILGLALTLVVVTRFWTPR